MQEITGAKPVRDANFRRVVHGEQQTHLTQNQAALDVQVVSRRPISSPSKHFQRCIRSVSESARCNSGWGLQFKWPPATVAARKHRSRASAQVGFISPLRPGQHRRLRPAFARDFRARERLPRRSTRAKAGFVAAIRGLRPGQPFFASMQQPADRFCKAILPGQHRLEAQSILLA